MMKSFLTIIFLLMLSWVMADEDISARNASLQDGRELQRMIASETPMLWVFQGDSVTLGMSCHLHGERSYADLWQELVRWEFRCKGQNRLNDVVMNVAQSGETAAAFLQREAHCMSPLRPQVIFIHFGINDARSGVSPEAYGLALGLLVKKARERGALPILLVPPLTRAPVAQQKQYEDAVRKLARTERTLLVDFAEDWRCHTNGGDVAPASWMSDDLHPNSIGHRRLHRVMARSLNMVPVYSETLLLPTEVSEGVYYQWYCLRRILSSHVRRFLQNTDAK